MKWCQKMKIGMGGLVKKFRRPTNKTTRMGNLATHSGLIGD